MRYPFDNWAVVIQHSNQEVVMDVVEREIADALPEASGERYPEQMMATVDR